ncbi:MAG: LysM peptidoglycan-binding domain-containing protein [Chloroflexi bacterium]|nr:LysM peptidoglycan-binding domain-containing protein [Chloroflexota bacterium]
MTITPYQTPNPTTAPTPTFIPTPNPTRAAIVDPFEQQVHVVQFGDTLGVIAERYGVRVEAIVEANNLPNENVLVVGQSLIIPTAIQAVGPSFKTIPDSELVYGPSVGDFSVAAFLEGRNSYLARYTENISGRNWSGPELIERVAVEQSVNPRLLLAALEYQSRWISRSEVSGDDLLYPMGYYERPDRVFNLYLQLDWAAKQLQAGYYGWRIRGLAATTLIDGTRVGFAPGLNAGSVGVQTLLAQTRRLDEWRIAAGHAGLFDVYVRLFGDPFQYAVEPLVPTNLTQPPLAFPWADEETWYYTGGPHGGWGTSSAWAALDFAANEEPSGCFTSDYYARAVADGVIARSEHGLVILDLDGDGDEGTGWTIFYLHVESEGRAVEVGDRVQVGDPIAFPSCEGGVSFSTHLHIARRYNGEWIAADCTNCLLNDGIAYPNMNFEGWTVFSFPREYDGSLIKGDDYREACACRADYNVFAPGNGN